MPKLSIIVPIYNVEPYLHRCLDSICDQTFIDFEAILVDDGSLDRCGEIVDEYVKKDARFVSIHQINQGVSGARNAGLKAAKGEYIGFIDPDDWIEPKMYESMIKTMEVKNCDIVSCSWFYNSPNTEQKYISLLQSSAMSGIDYTKHLFDIPPTIYGSACSKLFRREKINVLFDTEYKICEDNLFVAQYCANIKKAVYINEPLYHVFGRSDSATRSEPERVAYGLPARRKIIEIMSTVDSTCKELAERLYLFVLLIQHAKS